MIVAALASGALGGLLPGAGQPLCEVGGTVSECGRVTGIVLAIEGAGPADVSRFTLRTADGEVLDFAVERLELTGGGKVAPHLREHQVDGLPIEVEYKIDSGRHVALRYTDAE